MHALWLAAMLAVAVGPPVGAARVVNASAGAIWVRPEHAVEPVRVAPGTVYGGADALAQPAARPGRIYKVSDYCSVLVDARGGVRPLCQGLLSELFQLAQGGWKDERWRRLQVTAHYDHEWDPLFARSLASRRVRG
jgi:hypothetical protein